MMAKKTEKAVVIINPASGAGRALERWNSIEKIVMEKKLSFDLRFTKAAGHAIELSREAVKNEAPMVIAVGGDGTISEIAAGFLDEKGNVIQKKKTTALGIIAAGSGSDLIRTLGIPRDPEKAIDIIQQGNRKILDMGKISYPGENGKKVIRPFINISEVGIGAKVIEHLEKQGKSRGAWFEYQLATFKGIITYKNHELEIILDNDKKISGKFLGVMVANGKYYGSGMKIAPNAEPDDGLFDVVTLGDISKLRLILNSQKVRDGSHASMDGVQMYRAKKVSISSEQTTKMEIDGELIGQTPVELEIIPVAIPVLVP